MEQQCRQSHGEPRRRSVKDRPLWANATWLKGDHFSRPHSHPNDRFIFVLSGTWWAGTGTKFDPANLAVPLKAGSFATHFAKQVHWDGARDEDAALLIIGEGPATNTSAEAGK
jgi:hypothetical protein